MKRVFLLLLLSFSLCLAGCQGSDYKKATRLMEEKDYAAAAEIFKTLNDYKDSAELLVYCEEMAQAVSRFDAAAQKVEEQNEAAENALAAAKEALQETGKALDNSLKPALETAVSALKGAMVLVPVMDSDAALINKAAEKLEQTDYTALLTDLEGKTKAYTDSIKQYALVNQPTQDYVISCLQTVPGITDIEAVSEGHDPEGWLNRKGGYTAAVVFGHTNVNPDWIYGNTLADKGVGTGGVVEIFASKADAENRDAYLSSFDNSSLRAGYHRVIGTLVIRTSDYLHDDGQAVVEAQVIEALTRLTDQ